MLSEKSAPCSCRSSPQTTQSRRDTHCLKFDATGRGYAPSHAGSKSQLILATFSLLTFSKSCMALLKGLLDLSKVISLKRTPTWMLV